MRRKLTIRNGPVAFFDILGYKSIIDNNKIEVVAQLIVDHLEKTPYYLRDFIIKEFSHFGLPKKDLDRLAKYTFRLLLSDSILLTSKQPKGSYDLESRLWEWFLFLLECQKLVTWMFENGLPVKGAIGYGEYFRKRNCFAGKPIVDCFRLANSLDLAGCAFVPNAWNRIEEALTGSNNKQIADFINSVCLEYQVPVKSGKSKDLRILFYPLPNNWKGSTENKVERAFTAHRKEITEKVKTKFVNTVNMIDSFHAAGIQRYR